jgi:hypothetical protein
MASISPEKVRQLKLKMATDKNIADAVRFFLDNFVDSPGFMDLGHQKDLPDPVKKAVCQALGSALRKSEFEMQWVGSEIPEMQLIHGSVTVDGSMGIILWAPDIQTGILSVPKKPLSPEMLYVRMSLMPAKVN